MIELIIVIIAVAVGASLYVIGRENGWVKGYKAGREEAAYEAKAKIENFNRIAAIAKYVINKERSKNDNTSRHQAKRKS